MTPNKKQSKESRIPVSFAEGDEEAVVDQIVPESEVVDESAPFVADEGLETVEGESESQQGVADGPQDPASVESPEAVELADPELATLAEGPGESDEAQPDTYTVGQGSTSEESGVPSVEKKPAAGPMLAELLATRSELRRVETERNDLLERLARRQADFENYRKRVERERGETYQRMVGDVVSKLLPVMDNMRRALEAESLMEKNESAEFRHFLRGVELIYKQLNDALQELGVEAVPAVGQPFDPHLHEAVATEHSEEYEPDIVTQELLRGYRLGEKLLRPAMVKVSTRQ